MSKQQNRWPALRRLSLIAAAVLLAGAAQAQTRLKLEQPAQALDQAINQLVRQAGVQVFFASALAVGKQAPALKGSYTPREALERLLAGSGLRLSTQDERTFTLVPAAGAGEALPLVRTRASAEREPAAGAVGGYVAKRSITATKTDTALEKTPQAISVVPQEQIADQNALSVAEALRYSSGVFAEYRGASNLHDEMVLRGFQYAPRYLNGLLYGSGSLGQIDPYLLERVELLRGPSSVLYGQASPGGIVNLVSKQPGAEAKREVIVGTGNRNRLSAGVDVGGKLSDDGSLLFRVVASAEKVDLQENHLRQRRFSVSPSLQWTLSPQTELRVQALLQHEPDAGFRNFMEVAGVLKPTRFGYIPREFLVGDPNYDRSTRDQSALGYQLRHQVNEHLSLHQNLRINRIDSDYRTLIWNALQKDEETITRLASGGSEDMSQTQVDNQLQYGFSTGGVAHKLLAGLDLRHSRRDYQWGMNFGAPSINWRKPVYNVSTLALTDNLSKSVTTARQTGLYLQDQIAIGALSLVIGGRQDWAKTDIDDQQGKKQSRIDDRAFSGRVGAVYALPNGLSPYASYSTSFEPVLEASSQGTAFEPMKAKQVELGVKLAPERANYSFTAAAYELRQRNVLTYDYATRSNFQVGEIRARGLELEARAELQRDLNLLASFSHINAKVTRSADTSTIDKMPTRIPKQQLSLWAKYEPASGALAGLGLGLGLRRVGESEGDAANSFQVPGATLIDASLSFDFGLWSQSLHGLKLQLNAANLSDKIHVASCASRWACFYGNGRVITASARYTW